MLVSDGLLCLLRCVCIGAPHLGSPGGQSKQTEDPGNEENLPASQEIHVSLPFDCENVPGGQSLHVKFLEAPMDSENVPENAR